MHLPRPTELEAPNEEVRFVYFPTSGVASIVALDESGESVDTAMIGREGMTGLAVFLGTAPVTGSNDRPGAHDRDADGNPGRFARNWPAAAGSRLSCNGTPRSS